MKKTKDRQLRSELLRPDGLVILLLVVGLTFDSPVARWWFSSVVVTFYIAGRIWRYWLLRVTVDMAQVRR